MGFFFLFFFKLIFLHFLFSLSPLFVFDSNTIHVFIHDLDLQIKALKTELSVVRSNLTMMSDMMSQLDPVTVKEADLELLEVTKKSS